MPSVPDEFVPFDVSRPVRPEAPEPEGPGFLGTLAAGGEVANWVYRSWRHMENRSFLVEEPDHDPFALIRGTEYEADPERFAFSRSEEETRAVMREWDEDKAAKQVLARAGWGGTLAAIGMGALDPTLFVPVAAVASGGARGANALRIGADVALTAGATAAVGEAAMLATTPEMTGQDAVLNVGVATLLGGFLGTGAGALVSRAERQQLEAAMTADRLALAEEAAPARPASPASAGAAAADTRELQMRRVPGLSALPDPAGKAAPTRRVLNTPFTSARRALVDLAETPYIFEENLQGVATTQGGALDRTARIEMSRARLKIEQEFSRLYTDFRRQSGANTGPVASRVDRLIGRNYADWKSMVDDALRNGDRHDIPQVAEAARIYRETVIRPWTERAQAAGLLPEELDVKTAETYMMRNWNKERLVGERPEVVRTFAGWLEEEELKKVALQDRLRGLQDELAQETEKAKRLSAQLETRERQAATLDTRQQEISSLNRFAFARSSRMSQPLDDLRAEIRSVEAEIRPLLDNLAAMREQIASTKAQYPDIQEADRNIFRLISAAGKLRESGQVVDDVDALAEFSAAVDALRDTFRGGVRGAAQRAKELRVILKADDLVALERAREKMNRAISPYRTELNRLRSDLKAGEKRKLPAARGGAVFETEIRRRGNALADRASGVSYQADDLTARLARIEERQLWLRGQIEEAVAAWEGKSAREAKAALRKRASTDAERAARAAEKGGGDVARSVAADSDVDLAVRRILDSERITDRQELESLANEIIDRITGTPDGRLPYDMGGGGTAAAMAGRGDARGPLAARVFMIPDNRVRQWLNTDPQKTAEIFLNTMVPDVLLTERFGDVNMTDVMRRIAEEASQMEMAAKTPQERLAIQAQRDNAIADLAAIRDRIRHTYGFSSDPRQRFLGRMAQTAGRYNVVTNLGGVVLSSLPDLAGIQWRFGMTSAFRNAWGPFAKALFSAETRKAVMAQKRQLQTLGIAADTFLATRQSALYEVGEMYRPQSRFERGVKWGADKFQLASGLSYWTDFTKLAAGMVASTEALAAVRAVAGGKPKARQIRNLAEGGIDAAMASRIVRQLEAGGAVDVVDGIEIPNTGNWTDRGARDAFEALIARDVDMMVLTPGQEKALMFSKPIGGLILQFKSFVQAANERLLVRSMQARDIYVLQGLVSAVALGVLGETIYSWLNDRPLPDNPANIIKSGVERSGVLGWYQEANSLSAKFSGGAADVFRLAGADRPDSRYISRSVLGAFLGPTANKFEDLVRVTGTAANLDWSAADTRRLRRMVPGQNLFYIRRLLDRLEGDVNEAFGIEPLKK